MVSMYINIQQKKKNANKLVFLAFFSSRKREKQRKSQYIGYTM